MEPNKNAIPLIISFFSLIFFDSAQAVCVPRNNTHRNPSSPQTSPEAHPPVSHISASSPTSHPPSESAPPSPQSNSFLPPPSKATPPIMSPNSAPALTPAPPKSTQPPTPPPSNFNFPLVPAIQTICDATDNPILCLSSIAPFLSDKADPVSVLEMSIQACSLHAKMALSRASKIIKVDKSNSAAVRDCMEIYNDALDNLESAVDAIPVRDIGTINSMLSAVLTDFETCEDGFSGESSPLSVFDNKGTKLASNCLAIASLIM